jgi:phosphoglycolate phosphatase-like HAD superfamily hydrolase
MSKINTIYLDLDGVLCDFVRRYQELYNMHPSEAEKSKVFQKYFDEFIGTQQFATLDWMPGAQGLLAKMKTYKNVSIEILSSTATEDKYDEISRQKNIWCDTHHVYYRRNYVPGKRFKWKYAEPDAILIDDTKSNINQWNDAGGVGILHTTLSKTLNELDKHIIGTE